MKWRVHLTFLSIWLSICAMSVTPARADTHLVVFAASSLSQSFNELGRNFEKSHPGTSIQFSFLSSSTLAAQILAGAPADVFASASESDMAKVGASITNPTLFAVNRIVLGAAISANPPINKLTDLNRRGVKWLQCVLSAPCGYVTDRALGIFAKVKSKPVSYEANVASVVAKLVSGEADAGFIYHTDYLAHSGALREIRFADTSSTITRYPIGVVKGSPQSALAQRFVAYVLSAQGRAVLTQAGFSRPQ